jgi:hypothetical protein
MFSSPKRVNASVLLHTLVTIAKIYARKSFPVPHDDLCVLNLLYCVRRTDFLTVFLVSLACFIIAPL